MIPYGNQQFDIDPAFPQIHLNFVPWPDNLEGYDVKHGLNTAKLALVILSHDFPAENTEQNMRALWCGALLHDLGRQKDFRVVDDGCAQRSALLAEQTLKNPQHGVEFDANLREVTCRLIADHDLANADLPIEPLAQALWDADAYEACRFRPGTHDGLKALKQFTAPDRLCTSWAKDRNNLKRYMNWRGW